MASRGARFASSVLLGLIALAGCDRSSPNPPGSVATTAPLPGGRAPSATAPDPWAAKPVVRDPLKKPLLWSATKDGHTIYFLGTIHMGVDAEARLPQIVFDKLDSAPAFAMETDISDPSVAKAGDRDAGGSLHEDLGSDYYAKLETQITPNMAKAIDGKKALVATTLLSLKGLPTTPPMDRVLLGHALDHHEKIIYLEPAKLQVEVLEKYMTVRELKMMLDHPERGPVALKKSLDGYLAGDETAFLAVADEEKAEALADGYTEAEYTDAQEALIYRRNASWIDRIEQLAKEGGGFVAVGAMHLVGPRSVLDLLSQRGFEIKRVDAPPAK